MKDIPMLYTVSQTAATETESLHAVVSLFTPKMLGFHFEVFAFGLYFNNTEIYCLFYKFKHIHGYIFMDSK